MGNKAGAIKVAAARVGIPEEEYKALRKQGLKWCYKCAHWINVDQFSIDNSRGDKLSAACLSCKRVKQRKKKVNSPPSVKVQQQASSAVSYEVKKGNVPNINTCICDKCGTKAAHYHHPRGYQRQYWLDVVPLCRSCHKGEHYDTN